MGDRSPPFNRRQSIPLQDLSRPLDQAPEWRSPRRRTRTLLGQRHPFTGRVDTAYEPVGEGSPPAHGAEGVGLPHVTTPRNAHQPPIPYDDGEVSPVNVENFQAAMGSVGLNFESPGPSRPPPGKRRSTLNVITENHALSTFLLPSSHTREEAENDNYYTLQDSDRTPLTDSRFVQPISGAPRTAEPNLRLSPASARHSRSGSRLGDELRQIEAGTGRRPPSTLSSRSLDPAGSASPLSRAGTMIRRVSQRVVNLSNEPDAIDQDIRQQRSSREARMEEPPILPAMADYAHDGRPNSPLEKSRPSVSMEEPQDTWEPQPNPLKGKTLGLFSPDNWIRLKFCEMLVHPVTEPVILILIVIQTILLAIDSAPNLGYDKRPKAWQASWINFGLLGLFTIYTLEIVARIIVSGLIKNADEYSTLDTTLGFKTAFGNRIRTFLVPQRQLASKNQVNEAGQQPSILRTFTGMQLNSDPPGHSRQQQRVRLARRAFLRHGFNRLDFVAVVSFWIMFVLSMVMVEHNRHVYIFRMLSCLRILRLLGLTSGTSVSS